MYVEIQRVINNSLCAANFREENSRRNLEFLFFFLSAAYRGDDEVKGALKSLSYTSEAPRGEHIASTTCHVVPPGERENKTMTVVSSLMSLKYDGFKQTCESANLFSLITNISFPSHLKVPSRMQCVDYGYPLIREFQMLSATLS
ncbi:hypothetical protein GDO78_004924 [Eleutherodactylus coqui]|uniref:Uncharacterized protein n=1 Tax=Eleutherodactylus coqui TaxID=57060 RepID=A0A8J6FKK9_ELECQ|nr:hypothetical protein GDO78_004924 [Eleutherodactylus coqui]